MPSPFVVDLDGTLIRTDLLYQSLFLFIKQKPLQLIAPFFWISKGKSHLKTELAHRVSIDISVLPYDTAVIALIKGERAKNRQIILATASHKIYADQIAKHLNLFDRVVATDGTRNFSSYAKRDFLVEEFGNGGFDYAGNSHADIPVWESAGKAYIVNPERGVEKRALKKGNVERIIKSPSNQFGVWLKALRPHQWIKNLLIFVPLLAAHELINCSALLSGLLGFVFFHYALRVFISLMIFWISRMIVIIRENVTECLLQEPYPSKQVYLPSLCCLFFLLPVHCCLCLGASALFWGYTILQHLRILLF